MKKTYIVANICWLALAGAVCLEAWRLGVGGLHTPGPGFIAFYTALLMGILAVISLYQSIRDEQGPVLQIWGGIRFGKLGLMIGALFLYAALLDTLGFMVGTFLLLLVLFRIVKPYGWKRVLLYSLLTLTGVYFFFVVLLESRLPEGLLHL